MHCISKQISSSFTRVQLLYCLQISTGVMLMPFRLLIKAIKDVGSRNSPCRQRQTHQRDSYTCIHTKAHTCRAHATVNAGDEARFRLLQMTQLETGLPEQQFPSCDYTGTLWVTFQPTEHAPLWIMYNFGVFKSKHCVFSKKIPGSTLNLNTQVFLPLSTKHYLSKERDNSYFDNAWCS